MTAERELAGFALPFTAGAAFTFIFPSIFWGDSPLATGIILTLLACGLTVLLHPTHKRLTTSTLWISIICIAFCCGLTCAISSTWVLTNGNHHHGIIGSLMDHWGESLRNCIESIPFNNHRTNAIIKALITGEKSALDCRTSEIFRSSGASHILALSGMHLGIIYGMLKIILIPLGNTRRSKSIKTTCILTLCCIYTLMTGAGASLTRALIFIFISETAIISGRFKDTGSILLASLTIQIALFPQAISDIGFQLSYAAMAGIAYIYPHLQKLWPQANKNEGGISKGIRWLWSTAALSIACQLTTAPLAYIYFGTFPKYFILTNLISSPLVLIIIPYSIIVTALTSMGACPAILAEYLEKLVNILIDSLSIIASL